MIAKYANHAKIHFKCTGKHLGVVNDTTLGRRSDLGEVKLELADLNALAKSKSAHLVKSIR